VSLPALERRAREAVADTSDDRALRRRVVDVLHPKVGFDAFVWLLIDPLTGVGTSPIAEVPSLERLPELIRLRYRVRPRWTALDPGRPVPWPPDADDAWARALRVYGVRDVVTVALGDRFGLWGVLDLWRVGGRYSPGELEAVGSVAGIVTAGLRRAQAESLTRRASAPGMVGPAVMVLGPDLVPRTQTDEAEHYLRALLPTEEGRRPVPAAAYNVGAQLLAVEAGLDDTEPVARAHLVDGRWLTFRAARLGAAPDGDVAVSMSLTAPRDRLQLYARAHGLTARETEVLDCLADGDDTRGVAARLFVSEFTVQDHLKAMFDKTGLRTRRSLVARALGG
jgi:DNA-binding CsgD family transcriptional regulator